MDLFVGKQVQHPELGKGEVLDVWPEMNSKATWACVLFDSGTSVTCKDATLQEVSNGN